MLLAFLLLIILFYLSMFRLSDPHHPFFILCLTSPLHPLWSYALFLSSSLFMCLLAWSALFLFIWNSTSSFSLPTDFISLTRVSYLVCRFTFFIHYSSPQHFFSFAGFWLGFSYSRFYILYFSDSHLKNCLFIPSLSLLFFSLKVLYFANCNGAFLP